MANFYEKIGELVGGSKTDAKSIKKDLKESKNQIKKDWDRETNKAKESFEKGKESSNKQSDDKSLYEKASDKYNEIHEDLFGEDGVACYSADPM